MQYEKLLQLLHSASTRGISHIPSADPKAHQKISGYFACYVSAILEIEETLIISKVSDTVGLPRFMKI